MRDNRFINGTKRVWQEWAEVEITDEDAREIIQNIRGFFGVLAEWRERDEQQEDRNDE